MNAAILNFNDFDCFPLLTTEKLRKRSNSKRIYKSGTVTGAYPGALFKTIKEIPIEVSVSYFSNIIKNFLFRFFLDFFN